MTPKLHVALNVNVVLEDNLPEAAEPEAAACCAVGQPEIVQMGGRDENGD
jgi:hypothetical protein